MSEARNTLLNWLGANQTDRVLSGLEALAGRYGDAQLRNDCVLQRGRYRHLLEQERDHLISAEQARQERARIRKALVSLIDALPDAWETQPLAQIPAGRDDGGPAARKPLPWKAIGAAVVAVTAVLASIAAFSGYTLKELLGGKAEQDSTVVASSVAAAPDPSAQAASFAIDCWTQQGEGALQEYKEGEIMRLFYQADQPCYVRAVKKQANKTLLLIDEWRVGADDAGQHRELGQGFRTAAPFGRATIYFFAQQEPFEPLPGGSTSGSIVDAADPDQVLSSLRAAGGRMLFAADSIQLISYR